MRPTSSSQADAARLHTIPAMEEVGAGIWALPSPIEGSRLGYAFIWALVDSVGDVHLIDAGVDSPSNRALLARQLRSLGISPQRVRNVVVTHLHGDHTGLAEWLRAEHGSEVVMSAAEHHAKSRAASAPDDVAGSLERWCVPSAERESFKGIRRSMRRNLTVTRTFEPQEVIELGNRTLEVLATPGHTAGHVALVDRRQRKIYTGDHVLPTVHPGVGLGGESDSNPLEDFISSCEALEPYADFEALPGHGYRFVGVVERAALSVAHHLRRAAEVDTILRTAPHASVWEVAQRLRWSVGWSRFSPDFRFSAMTQTEVFKDYVERSTAPIRLPKDPN